MILTMMNCLNCSYNSRISLSTIIILIIVPFFGLLIFVAGVSAQEKNQWTDQRTIPMYHPETEPPILIADQSGTVHAFSYQGFGDLDNPAGRAIMYNQWTPETGWTTPIDILLSPIKNDARLLDVFLDESGIFHVVFFGGDEAESGIYYSRAPMDLANFAPAWSQPVVLARKALIPESGAIAGDDKGNLIVIFSGLAFGRGWFTTISPDSGNTWSDVEMVFPVYTRDSVPYYLQTIVSEDGRLHAVWSLNDQNNHGLEVYYSNYNFDVEEWSVPLVLAEQRNLDDLGTQAPVISEYNNALFVIYYDGSTNQRYFTRSMDGGQSWSKPVTPFPQIGQNGIGSFARRFQWRITFLLGSAIGWVPRQTWCMAQHLARDEMVQRRGGGCWA